MPRVMPDDEGRADAPTGARAKAEDAGLRATHRHWTALSVTANFVRVSGTLPF
jgi:hypothetical protein